MTGYGQNADANTRLVVSVLHDGMFDVKLRNASTDDVEIILDHSIPVPGLVARHHIIQDGSGNFSHTAYLVSQRASSEVV